MSSPNVGETSRAKIPTAQLIPPMALTSSIPRFYRMVPGLSIGGFTMADVPDGLYARIPLGEVTLAEAVGVVDDPAWFYDTMAPILFHFTVFDYWVLTVADHRRLFDYLVARGLYGDQS